MRRCPQKQRAHHLMHQPHQRTWIWTYSGVHGNLRGPQLAKAGSVCVCAPGLRGRDSAAAGASSSRSVEALFVAPGLRCQPASPIVVVHMAVTSPDIYCNQPCCHLVQDVNGIRSEWLQPNLRFVNTTACVLCTATLQRAADTLSPPGGGIRVSTQWPCQPPPHKCWRRP